MSRTATAAIAAIALAGFLVFLGQIFAVRSLAGAAHPPAKAGDAAIPGATVIHCTPVEQLATHYHFALLIHEDGRVVTLPAGTGIEPLCIYWIHVHDGSGIVHVEAPSAYQDHAFLLVDAFSVAGLRLDRHHLGGASFPGGEVAVYDNGVRWTGEPGALPPKDLDTVDVVAPGQPYRYLPFGWPPGFRPPPTS